MKITIHDLHVEITKMTGVIEGMAKDVKEIRKDLDCMKDRTAEVETKVSKLEYWKSTITTVVGVAASAVGAVVSALFHLIVRKF